jgi:hypothetical protein
VEKILMLQNNGWPTPGRIFDVFATQRLYPAYGLALLRMGYGLAVLVALLPDLRSFDEVWGGERSYLPALLAEENAADGQDLRFIFVLAVTLLAAFTLMIGAAARLSALVLVFSYRSVIDQNSYLSDGGDNLLQIALIFVVFANVSEVWSVDGMLRRNFRFSLTLSSWYRPIANSAWILLVMQVCVVYVVAGLAKIRGESWMAGEGVIRSLASIQFQAFPALSRFMLEFDWILVFSSVFVVLLQVYFPFLVASRWTRVPTLFLMISFHAAIGLVMGLTSFALAMIASEMVFVSDNLVRRISRRRWLRGRTVEIPVSAHPGGRTPAPSQPELLKVP